MDTPILSQTDTVTGNDADLIKDTTTAGFIEDVIEASREVPILVDFWAPWCGPCKQLTPVLEKAVKAARGAVRLVKMNIEEHPEIPGQLGVQSIPAVFAFKDGRPADAFMGAQPESQIKAFIERVAGSDGLASAGSGLEQADAAFEAGDYQSASELYAAVLAEDREDLDAIAGLARCQIDLGELERARETLDLAPENKANATQIKSVRAMLDLAARSGKTGDLDELKRRLEGEPADHQARMDLAMALNAAGSREEAADELIEIIRRDSAWNDEAARNQLLQFFEAWGAEDPATVDARRRLSTLLFA